MNAREFVEKCRERYRAATTGPILERPGFSERDVAAMIAMLTEAIDSMQTFIEAREKIALGTTHTRWTRRTLERLDEIAAKEGEPR